MVDLSQLGEHSAMALFFALFFATFLSEDATCIAAGTMAAQEHITLAAALAACFLGIFVGDMLLYWAGRFFGARLFSRFVSDSNLDKATEWLEKRGPSAVFLSRFITGLRLPTYLAAGLLRTNFARFAFYFALAVAIWTPLIVGSVYIWQEAVSGSVLLAAVAAFLAVRVFIKLVSWKERRLLFGRIKRVANWEFWPLSIFYLPVVIYVLFLAIRFRSLTAFTCANPGMPAGGFVGESKDRIYCLVSGSEAARKYLLRHRMIPHSQDRQARLSEVYAFLNANQLSLPVVIKPDKGERGKGVGIVRSEEGLAMAVAVSNEDLIIQEFYDGVEVSIFYYRFPEHKNGKIFSVTEKRFPIVTGDGRSELETLILKDKRAVCTAHSYLNHNRYRLSYVPTDGEEIRLIDIGTHSRGAIFLDGLWLKTDALERKIDEICRGINGFYFGRFDLRATSLDELCSATSFKIIELNGVTSESTNIYDPRYSLFDAYRILFKQWRLAFEIGRENYKLGAKRMKLMELIRLILRREVEAPSKDNQIPSDPEPLSSHICA